MSQNKKCLNAAKMKCDTFFRFKGIGHPKMKSFHLFCHCKPVWLSFFRTLKIYFLKTTFFPNHQAGNNFFYANGPFNKCTWLTLLDRTFVFCAKHNNRQTVTNLFNNFRYARVMIYADGCSRNTFRRETRSPAGFWVSLHCQKFPEIFLFRFPHV